MWGEIMPSACLSFLLATTFREEQGYLCAISFFKSLYLVVFLAKRISLCKKVVTIFYVYISAPAPVSFLLCFYGSVISLDSFS
jgi:hypothetical protein